MIPGIELLLQLARPFTEYGDSSIKITSVNIVAIVRVDRAPVHSGLIQDPRATLVDATNPDNKLVGLDIRYNIHSDMVGRLLIFEYNGSWRYVALLFGSQPIIRRSRRDISMSMIRKLLYV